MSLKLNENQQPEESDIPETQERACLRMSSQESKSATYPAMWLTRVEFKSCMHTKLTNWKELCHFCIIQTCTGVNIYWKQWKQTNKQKHFLIFLYTNKQQSGTLQEARKTEDAEALIHIAI